MLSCQCGIADFVAGLIERRPTKNEVFMMSNLRPWRRASTSAFGMLGVSM